MIPIESIADYLESLAPATLAEEWDNVGLLVGARQAPVERLMTCLTITEDTVAEAIDQEADLIVAHHPLPFKPLKRLTRDTPEGRYLLDLLSKDIAIYSAHTAFDSAASGINQRLAEGIGLEKIEPLVAGDTDLQLGSGRCGCPAEATTSDMLADRIKSFLEIEHLRRVGRADQTLERVAVACGNAGSFLEVAQRKGCDAILTGETSFHTCLAAEAEGMAMFLTGHFASEHFAMQRLAEDLADHFSELTVWASRNEKDPLQLI